PFHTTRTRGTGLGLAVARRMVEQHGGSISVENAASGGAVFSVVLPRA
ncbi:MAG TPA: ATP-binding protein, partial [Aggregicoccus sp.]|nr:ATP-binding protein [Aggregicoccus sp.]